ncbi:peptidoglycan DD-metalloendopeptidase family protein [Flavilitoribacter nigricans]|uniref:Peptidase M23 n=1 Tax=Flavilitoribacter nigricans (strain ATCC 23147 / DSM 23189 / NBRC 102662 / NCIMB 1420 / SS-2) TaxID=1122177 RepID=A0A2D0MXQ4_FLAN2|nr:peptidoglycan DD-metalloendopeptidase family protein [Flavilitoribacter nigricans]PHN00960.1 peptidase M23 [Flavilitoribacter nigricans DSM 23189 = NBRC 102662]
MNQHPRYFSLTVLLFAGLLLFSACDRNTVFGGLLSTPKLTPREAYLAALDSTGLANTQLGKAWRRAGSRALADSVLTQPPFRETGYFRAEDPDAIAYRMELKTGELLKMKLVTTPDSIRYFVDLFRDESTDSTVNFRHLLNTEEDQTDSLDFEVEEAGTYILRIQPELLASTRYTLDLIVQPVYGAFPVSGKQNRDIWSFFGDPRDGGKRDHKGIDIFARRGTPVVAAVDGMVRSVRDRGLGGKQVWLSDPVRHQSLYYAHLDSQLVREGQMVKAGDTLGLVGNTGNARNTRPHLHFGIYRRGYGAIDPHPYVAFQTDKTPGVRADTAQLGNIARVRRSNTRLSAAPQSRSRQLATLDRYLPLEVLAASANWYRVRSPQGLAGYLPANALENLNRSIGNLSLDRPVELLQAPTSEAAPVAALPADTKVDVVGISGDYRLIRDPDGATAWMMATPE